VTCRGPRSRRTCCRSKSISRSRRAREISRAPVQTNRRTRACEKERNDGMKIYWRVNCASGDALAHLLRWSKHRSWLSFVPCYIRRALYEYATILADVDARVAVICARVRTRASAVFESVASMRESLVGDHFFFIPGNKRVEQS